MASRNATSSGMLRAALARLRQHDLRAGLEVRRLDRHRQAPGQARLQARLQAFDFARVAVAGQDDLLLAVEQRVEGVEELFLRAVLAGEELDVVDQQRVDLLELALELVHRLVLQRLHHRAEELLASAGTARACPGCARAWRCRRRTSGGSCPGRCRRTAAAGCGRGRPASARPARRRRGRAGCCGLRRSCRRCSGCRGCRRTARSAPARPRDRARAGAGRRRLARGSEPISRLTSPLPAKCASSSRMRAR